MYFLINNGGEGRLTAKGPCLESLIACEHGRILQVSPHVGWIHSMPELLTIFT